MNACRVCGCTEERACPGGCSWVEPDLCSSCHTRALAASLKLADPEVLLQPVAMEISVGMVAMLHGNLCLALRHPGNTGPSRQFVEGFVEELEGILVEAGVFTDEQLVEIRRQEHEAQPRIILARG